MKYIKLLVVFIAFTSCVEVEFKSPMPSKGSKLDKLPEDLISYFMSLDKDSAGNNKLNLNELNSDFDWNEPLPEDVILKKWKHKYFLNQKGDNFWQIIMIKPEPNNSFGVYQLDGNEPRVIAELKSITKVEEFFNEDGDLDRVVLDPSLKEFKKIIKSNAFEKIDLFED